MQYISLAFKIVVYNNQVDIINFDEYQNEININNINKLIIGCYICFDEDLDYRFILKNGVRNQDLDTRYAHWY